MKKLLFTILMILPFVGIGQIQTNEFKMGYKKGYQDGYLKSNGVSYNGVLDFSKVYTWIEITDTLTGDTYTENEKNKNYERGYYKGYNDVCGCICKGKIASGNARKDSNRIKKITNNLYKYRKKIDRLKKKLVKTKDQIKTYKILDDIASYQETIRLILSSCNWFL